MTARVKLPQVSMAIDTGPYREVDGHPWPRVERHLRFELL